MCVIQYIVTLCDEIQKKIIIRKTVWWHLKESWFSILNKSLLKKKNVKEAQLHLRIFDLIWCCGWKYKTRAYIIGENVFHCSFCYVVEDLLLKLSYTYIQTNLTNQPRILRFNEKMFNGLKLKYNPAYNAHDLISFVRCKSINSKYFLPRTQQFHRIFLNKSVELKTEVCYLWEMIKNFKTKKKSQKNIIGIATHSEKKSKNFNPL